MVTPRDRHTALDALTAMTHWEGVADLHDLDVLTGGAVRHVH